MAMHSLDYDSPSFPRKSHLDLLSQRLHATQWFSHVGTGGIHGVDRAHSWQEVERLMGEDPYNRPWEKMLEDASNAMSLRAYQENSERFMETWNPIAFAVIRHVDPLLHNCLLPKLHELPISRIVFDNIRGVTRSWCIYIAYFDDPDIACIERTIVELLIAGRCPCGYSGVFPTGTLTVY